MALFVEIQVDPEVAADPELSKRLVETCPVDIFARGDGAPLQIIDANVDECTLCDLCIEAAPKGTVEIIKLYEQD